MADWQTTQLIVPPWWVTAYQASCAHQEAYWDPFVMSKRQRLTPALTVAELNAVGVLLCEIQKQILEGKSKVCLTFKNHKKFAPRHRPYQNFAYERVLQILPTLSLLPQEVKGATVPLGLFIEQEWSMVDHHVAINLVPSELGVELILGFADAHEELGRRQLGTQQVVGIGADFPPLLLGRSVWLELEGREQTMLLNMEIAMQRDRRQVNLDNLFDLELEDMCSNVTLPRRAVSPSSILGKWLKTLDRLGKKLECHGVLRHHLAQEYLAFGASDIGCRLIWNSGFAKMREYDSQEYQKACACFFLKRFLTHNGGPFFQELSRQNAKNREVWTNLLNFLKNLEDSEVDALTFNGLLIGEMQVFSELTLRQHAHLKELELPSSLKESRLGWLTSPDNTTSLSERYAEYIRIVRGDQMLRKVIVEAGDWGKFGQTIPTEELVIAIENENKAESSHQDKLEKKSLDSSSSDPHMILEKESDRKKSEKFRMKKVADDLVWLRENKPQRYRQVRDFFIESLKEEKRQMIREVQKRLKPAVFDDHLKHTLSKFILENPSMMNGEFGREFQA